MGVQYYECVSMLEFGWYELADPIRNEVRLQIQINKSRGKENAEVRKTQKNRTRKRKLLPKK